MLASVSGGGGSGPRGGLVRGWLSALGGSGPGGVSALGGLLWGGLVRGCLLPGEGWYLSMH